MGDVRPGTEHYELWYRPGSATVARYAIGYDGKRTPVSEAAIHKARQRGKRVIKIVFVPESFDRVIRE